MHIPKMLYGTHTDVWKRCRSALKGFLAGEQPLLEAIEADGMLDSADHPGLIVLMGGSAATARGVHFQCYVPLRVLTGGVPGSLGRQTPEVKETVRTQLLERPWGMLCLLDSNNMNGFFPLDGNEYYRRFLRAALSYWDTLGGEGERYSPSLSSQGTLWGAATPVVQALARVGVPLEALTGSGFGPIPPLPEGGLPVLIAQADPALAGDLIGFAATFAARLPAGSRQEADVRPVYWREPPSASPYAGLSEPMRAAIRADNPVAVQRLIELGEPVEGFNPDTMDGPLSWAARRGHVNLVRFLLDRSASIEATGEDGQTPLQEAAFHGHPGTVRVLLERGANPYHVTRRGMDVLKYAEMSGNRKVIAILQPYWADKDPDFHIKRYFEEHPGE